MCGCILGVFGGFEMDLSSAMWRPSPALATGTPADYHRPGFSDAGPKVRSWMPQLGQDGNPRRRRLVHAFAPFGASWQASSHDGNGWNRSSWPMQSIGKMPVVNVVLSILQKRVMSAPCASATWQTADAMIVGRVEELGMMQPSGGKTGARTR